MPNSNTTVTLLDKINTTLEDMRAVMYQNNNLLIDIKNRNVPTLNSTKYYSTPYGTFFRGQLVLVRDSFGEMWEARKFSCYELYDEHGDKNNYPYFTYRAEEDKDNKSNYVPFMYCRPFDVNYLFTRESYEMKSNDNEDNN